MQSRHIFTSSGRRELAERRELRLFKIDFSTDTTIVLAVLIKELSKSLYTSFKYQVYGSQFIVASLEC